MRKWTKYEKLLLVLFVLTIPVVRPWIHGDGKYYYAFARAILFQGNLDFGPDWYNMWKPGKLYFTSYRTYVTPTGHLWNHFSVGPAILWSPFLITARAITPAVDWVLGTHFANDGFSKPYMIAMAVGTMFYGFLTLLLSLRMARKYAPEHWAFLAVFGIWLASAFTFYLYVEPSLSHAHSAFVVALFVWYWDRTREHRKWWQWVTLGAIAGLVMDTYYANALVLTLLLIDLIRGAWMALRNRANQELLQLVYNACLFAVTALIVVSPTLISKKIIFGSYWQSGYREIWSWNSPGFFGVCFSSHGVFSWTPILIPAVVGLFMLRRTDRSLSFGLLATLVAFIYFIGCFENWPAIPSFGNRFFVAFTLIFIVGLAVFLKELDAWTRNHRLVWPTTAAIIALLALWNCGVIYQWAAHLFPHDGEVSWSQIAYNQMAVVPGQVVQLVRTSLEHRLGLK